jgi:hypothetical protein
MPQMQSWLRRNERGRADFIELDQHFQLAILIFSGAIHLS